MVCRYAARQLLFAKLVSIACPISTEPPKSSRLHVVSPPSRLQDMMTKTPDVSLSRDGSSHFTKGYSARMEASDSDMIRLLFSSIPQGSGKAKRAEGARVTEALSELLTAIPSYKAVK